MTVLLECRVKYPPAKTFPSRFDGEPRQNIVVTDNQGRDHTVWFTAGRYAFQRDEAVTLLADDTGKLSIVERAATVPVVAPPPSSAFVPPASASGSGSFVAPAAVAAPTMQPTAPTAPTAAPTMQPTAPTAPLALVQQRAALLRSCHAQVQGLFTSDRGELIVLPETVQKYATTLFIQVCKELGSCA